MVQTLYKCARCGKRINKGNEHFLFGNAYGKKCYEFMLLRNLEFETMIRKKAKHG